MKIIMIIELDVMDDNSIRRYENNNGNSISN